MTTNTLKEQAELALQKLLEKTIEAGEFIASEVPLVIQELLMWEFTISVIMSLLGLTVLLGGLYLFKRYLSWGLKEDDTGRNNIYKNDLEGFFVVPFWFGIPILLVISSFMINLTWLQIWLAPRVFLIEYASKLVQ